MKYLIFFFILLSTMNAQTTLCFKENHTSMSTIESTPLDGGLCQGKKSIQMMEQEGWNINDIKIDGNNYIYILKKNTVSQSEIDMDQLEANIINKIQKEEKKKEKKRVQKIKQNKIKSGKQLYANKCQNCHGNQGEKRPSNTSRPIATLPLKQFLSIMKGYVTNDEDVDRGRAIIMKPYADTTSEEDVKSIYAYLKSITVKKEYQ